MANPPPQSSHGVIARTQQWYAPEHEGGDVPFVPVVTVATVAQQVGAQGEQLPAYEQVSNAQRWYDPGVGIETVPQLANAPQPPFFVPDASDPSESLANTQTWLGAVVDLVAVKESPPAALPEQIAAFQSDTSQQQDRSTAQSWFMPDYSGQGFVPLASAAFDPAPTTGAFQMPDPSENLRNDATWFQTPTDPVDGPLRASRYVAPNGPLQVDPVGSYPYTVMADGAVSYWRLSEPFNNQTGQQTAGYYTAYDIATQVAAEFRTGQWVGIPASVKPGLLTGDSDGAVGFDGASYMYVPATEMYNPDTGDFTVEAWVKTTSDGRIAGSRTAVTNAAGWSLQLVGGGFIQFRLADGVAGNTITSNHAIADGTRHHVVVVRGSAATTIYIDGAQDITGGPAVRNVLTVLPFTVGADSSGGTLFTGDIDDLAIYPVALNASQVGTHYLTGTQGWAPVIAQPDASEQRANGQTWFTPDLPMETPFPNTTFPPSFDPATMDFGLDTQSDRSIQPVWFAPDADAHPESPIPTPTTATAAQDAGLWPDQSGQQDRGIQPTWYQEPDDTLAQYPTLPAIPITVPQMAALWQEQPGQERGNGQTWYNAALEPVDGPLQSWLFTTGSPALPGVPPAVLIDAETGDIFLSIGGNLIVSATNG